MFSCRLGEGCIVANCRWNFLWDATQGLEGQGRPLQIRVYLVSCPVVLKTWCRREVYYHYLLPWNDNNFVENFNFIASVSQYTFAAGCYMTTSTRDIFSCVIIIVQNKEILREYYLWLWYQWYEHKIPLDPLYWLLVLLYMRVI